LFQYKTFPGDIGKKGERKGQATAHQVFMKFFSSIQITTSEPPLAHLSRHRGSA